MAENRLTANILLRYDTYANWMNSTTVLMPGEAAVAVFPSNNVISRTDSVPANTPPAVGIKIGDGKHYFDELPWLQAVAADVYNWAKSSTKPSYSASEIIGLANYIEQYVNSGGSGISASAYRLAYNEATKQYTLQYQDAGTGEWMDTAGSIDFAPVWQHITYLENWANGATGTNNIGTLEPLVMSIRDELYTQLNKINYNDEEVPNQFVTSVKQNNGKISVTRAPIKASDIATGTLSVSQGGTGATSFPSGSVLIGNDTNAITTRELATTIYSDSTNAIPTAGAVTKYVDNATAGLTGAMHFVGEATVAVSPNSSVDPRIRDYTFSNAQPGDVILANGAQELVWTGSQWRLLGDEGSYAIKGSITNADISEDAAISQEKINGLTTDLSNKVDKEEGKGLSSQDYTLEEKEKLASIASGAQPNVIEHIFVNDVERLPTIVGNLDKSVNLQINTFDDEYKEKLDGIEAGAQVNEIEHIFVNGSELLIGMVSNKPKSVSINYTEYTQEEKEKLAGIEAEAEVNKINSIKVNGVTYTPDSNKTVSITIDQAALNLNVLEGAQIPGAVSGVEEVDQVSKKLQLARMAVTGNVQDLQQTQDTYIILDCGDSTEVI